VWKSNYAIAITRPPVITDYLYKLKNMDIYFLTILNWLQTGFGDLNFKEYIANPTDKIQIISPECAK